MKMRMKGFTPINLALHCIREFIMIHYMDLPYLSRFIVILYMVLQYLRGVIIIHYMDLPFLRGVIMIVHLQLGSNLRSLVRSKNCPIFQLQQHEVSAITDEISRGAVLIIPESNVDELLMTLEYTSSGKILKEHGPFKLKVSGVTINKFCIKGNLWSRRR